MGHILHPDRTLKNIVAVKEETARSAGCPIDILPTDIFIENAPPVPEGMHTPRLMEDNSAWEEVNPEARDAKLAAQTIANDNAKVIADLQAIDIASVRSIREWITAQPNPPQFLVDHEVAAQAKRAQLK